MIGFLNINSSTNTPGINTTLKPFYALKYLVDACPESENGLNVPDEIIEAAIAKVKIGDYSDFVLLYFQDYNDDNTVNIGDVIFPNNYLLALPKIFDLFDQEFNNSIQILVFTVVGNKFEYNPIQINQNTGQVEEIDCFPLQNIMLRFNDIKALRLADVTNVADWNAFLTNMNSVGVNFNEIRLTGNTVKLAGNLESVTELIIKDCDLVEFDISQLKFLQYTSIVATDINYVDNLPASLLEASFSVAVVDYINVDNLTVLTTLNFGNNQVTSFAPKGLTLLETLRCDKNLLTSLNIGSIPALETLIANNNAIGGLFDMSANEKLSSIELAENGIANLRFSNTGNGVSYLNAPNNQITTVTSLAEKLYLPGAIVNLRNNLLSLETIAELLSGLVANNYYPATIFLDGTGNASIGKNTGATANINTLIANGVNILTN